MQELGVLRIPDAAGAAVRGLRELCRTRIIEGVDLHSYRRYREGYIQPIPANLKESLQADSYLQQ